MSEEPFKYYLDVWQRWAEPYDENNSPVETVWLMIKAVSESEARNLAGQYEPKWKHDFKVYSKGSGSQYNLELLAGDRKEQFQRMMDKDEEHPEDVRIVVFNREARI